MSSSDHSDTIQHFAERITNVYEHTIDELDVEIGQFVLRNLAGFCEFLKSLPERDKRAALCVLISEARAAIINIEAACEHLAKQRTT